MDILLLQTDQTILNSCPLPVKSEYRQSMRFRACVASELILLIYVLYVLFEMSIALRYVCFEIKANNNTKKFQVVNQLEPPEILISLQKTSKFAKL